MSGRRAALFLLFAGLGVFVLFFLMGEASASQPGDLFSSVGTTTTFVNAAGVVENCNNVYCAFDSSDVSAITLKATGTSGASCSPGAAPSGAIKWYVEFNGSSQTMGSMALHWGPGTPFNSIVTSGYCIQVDAETAGGGDGANIGTLSIDITGTPGDAYWFGPAGRGTWDTFAADKFRWTNATFASSVSAPGLFFTYWRYGGNNAVVENHVALADMNVFGPNANQSTAAEITGYNNATGGTNGGGSKLGNVTDSNTTALCAGTSCGSNGVSGEGISGSPAIPIQFVVSTVDSSGVIDVLAWQLGNRSNNVTIGTIVLPSCTVVNCANPTSGSNFQQFDVNLHTPFISGANASTPPCQAFTKACRIFAFNANIPFGLQSPKDRLNVIGLNCRAGNPCWATSNGTNLQLFNLTNATNILGNLSVTGNNSNAACNGVACQVAIVLLPPNPPGLGVPVLSGVVSNYHDVLSWSVPNGSVQGYLLHRVDQFGTRVTFVLPASPQSYSDQAFTYNVTYNVTAFNILGNGPDSNNVTLTIGGQAFFGPNGGIYGPPGTRANIASALGVSPGAVDSLFGIFWIMVMAMAGFALSTWFGCKAADSENLCAKVPVWGTVGGAFLGFSVDIASGFFPLWAVVFILVFVVFGVLGARRLGGGAA